MVAMPGILYQLFHNLPAKGIEVIVVAVGGLGDDREMRGRLGALFGDRRLLDYCDLVVLVDLDDLGVDLFEKRGARAACGRSPSGLCIDNKFRLV